MLKRNNFTLSIMILAVFVAVTPALAGLKPDQELGKLLFFDRYLSINQNQSCATCHDPGAGFADALNLRLPDVFPTSAGSFTDLFGGRNAPTAAYALYSPPFFWDSESELYTGGQFWDGRASTLADQAAGPFLNPVEMAMPSKAAVLEALVDPANKSSQNYIHLFMTVYKIDLLASSLDVDNAYMMLARAIGQFEKSQAFMEFSSKWDYVQAGKAEFTDAEQRGADLFMDEDTAKCVLCHVPPLFTDFTYDNLGIPVNPMIAFAGSDLGLGAPGANPMVLPADWASQKGKFKVSTVRDIEMTAPYGHNGYFATLEEIVTFYNRRGFIDPVSGEFNPAFGGQDWGGVPFPLPEVTANVNVEELGALGLSMEEEADLVAFLKTLTDGYGRPLAPPYKVK